MVQQTYSNTYWGGLNVRDQADSLLLNSHVPSQAGWHQQQRIGVESPLSENMDFGPEEIRKRLGSASYKDLTSAMLASDTLISGVEFGLAADGTKVILIASAKTFYTDQSGSFVQINDSTSASYTHAADITKCKIIEEDGRVFAGLDGANKIQVYRTGADLDPELDNGNIYTDSAGNNQTITGTWGNGYAALASLHGRLCFANDSVVEFTPMSRTASSGIWDLTNGGAYFAGGYVKMLESFVPDTLDDVDSILYIGTSAGMELVTGFGTSDFQRTLQSAGSPLSHAAFFKSLNWLVYATKDKEILGLNGTRVINIGSRLKAADGTGPLDDMSESASATNSYGFYNRQKEQGGLAISTDSAHVNDVLIIIDFKQGEPVVGEHEQSWERRVRLLKWQIKNPADTDWFVGAFQRTGGMIGILAVGTLWTMDSGNDDFGTTAVESLHRTVVFTAGQGVEHHQKQWYRADFGNLSVGDHAMTVKVFLDRDPNPSETYTFNQVTPGGFILGTGVLGTDKLSSGGLVKNFHRLQARSEAIQLEFSDTNSAQPFKVATLGITYEVGALQR